jgi:hypothetical protein
VRVGARQVFAVLPEDRRLRGQHTPLAFGAILQSEFLCFKDDGRGSPVRMLCWESVISLSPGFGCGTGRPVLAAGLYISDADGYRKC